MARRLTYASLALAMALTLAACSGDDDGSAELAAGEDPAPSSVPTGTAAPPEPNACTLVEPETLESVNPRGKEPVNTLLIGDLTFDGCTIGGVYDVSFGVRVVDDGTELADFAIGGSGEPEPVDIGDEGFRNTTMMGEDVVSVTTVARFGDHVVKVRNDSLGNSNPDVRVAEDVTEALLVELGEAVPDGYEDSALGTGVGPGCLLADDETITDLVGEVQLARGGSADGGVRCTYLAERKLLIEVLPASNATELHEATAQDPSNEEVEVDGAIGAVLAERSGVLEGSFQPDEGSVGHLRVYSDGVEDLPVGPQEAVALLERFLAGQA